MGFDDDHESYYEDRFHDRGKGYSKGYPKGSSTGSSSPYGKKGPRSLSPNFESGWVSEHPTDHHYQPMPYPVDNRKGQYSGNMDPRPRPIAPPREMLTNPRHNDGRPENHTYYYGANEMSGRIPYKPANPPNEDTYRKNPKVYSDRQQEEYDRFNSKCREGRYMKRDYDRKARTTSYPTDKLAEEAKELEKTARE